MQDSEADRIYGKPQGISRNDSPAEDEAESASDVEDMFAAIDSAQESEEGREESTSEGSDGDQTEDLQALQQAVHDSLGTRQQRKRREKVAVQDEAVPESQYNLPAGKPSVCLETNRPMESYHYCGTCPILPCICIADSLNFRLSKLAQCNEIIVCAAPWIQQRAYLESNVAEVDDLPAGTDSGQLTLADMLTELGPQKGKMSTVHKQLQQLAKKGQAVEPPLPGPIRSRKERQAG